MDIETEKRKILRTIPEIKKRALQEGMRLRTLEKSLEMAGNSYSLRGTLYLPESDSRKAINIKITNSSYKFLDLDREAFMYALIKKIGYPSPTVFMSGKTNGAAFLVREYVEGEQLRGAPQRVISSCLPTIASFFCDLHSDPQLRLEGFGRIEQVGNTWQGNFDSWINSLGAKARQSFDRMKKSRIPVKQGTLDQLLEVLDRQRDLLNIKHKSILHGDAGLINFLGDERGLTGIIDTEFALIGDPAYEFSDKVGDNRDYSKDFLNRYLNLMKEKGADVKSESFLRRGIIYSPFIVADIIPNLWEAGNHDGAMYFVSILPEEIEKAELA